jgi:hypothetical protein
VDIGKSGREIADDDLLVSEIFVEDGGEVGKFGLWGLE